jgi:uncharacterized iron-regulated membrane protein
MLQSFRLSMAWMHTWFGLVLGYVLMVAFFFGALSVFDREIDRWALPETRFEPQLMPSYDNLLKPVLAQIKPDEVELSEARKRVTSELPETLQPIGWGAYVTHRDPVLSLFAEFAIPNNPKDPADHVHGHATLDPRTGRLMADDQLKIGTQFFYPLHFSLHLEWMSLGYWIVGLAALIMLAALVSGVVMHRKIFKELFTFRPHKKTQRSALDLHNLTGVVALPFHFIFALTGLIIFAGIYLPIEQNMLQPLSLKHAAEEAKLKGLPFEPAGVAAPMASVDAMIQEAKQRWEKRGMPGEVGFLWVTHLGDANSYVSIHRAGSDRVALVGQAVHFSGTSGAVLYEEPTPTLVSSIHEFLVGLHLQHFEHWLLRWFYVLGGLVGCVCIATGFIFFVEKRKRQMAAANSGGARWVDAFAITTVTGMLIATLAILVANRLLPEDLAHRDSWEKNIFWSSWCLCLLHALWRSAPVLQARIAPAWREQCWAVALLALAAPLLNWITTGDHLLNTLGHGYWPVAGLDLVMLLTAVLATTAALHLRRRERSAQNVFTSTPEIAHA